MSSLRDNLLLKWLFIVIVSEFFLLWRQNDLVMIYAGISFFFLALWIMGHVCPFAPARAGRFRNFSAGLIALIYANIALVWQHALLRLLLIFCSSLIIMPHLFPVLTRRRQ